MYEYLGSLPHDAVVAFLVLLVMLIVNGTFSGVLHYLTRLYPSLKNNEYHQAQKVSLNSAVMFVMLVFSLYLPVFKVQIFTILANLFLLLAILAVVNLSLGKGYEYLRANFDRYGYWVIMLVSLLSLIFWNDSEARSVRSIIVSSLAVSGLLFALYFRLKHWKALTFIERLSPLVLLVSTVAVFLHATSYIGFTKYFDLIFVAFSSSFLVLFSLAVAFFGRVVTITSVAKMLTSHTENLQPANQTDASAPLEKSLASVQIPEPLASLDEAADSRCRRLIDKYDSWIAANYANHEETVDRAILAIGTSYATLNRHLKDRGLPSAKKMLTDYRLAKATELLSSLSSSETAYKCGFKTPSHFTQAFRAKFGVTPTDYRKQVDGVGIECVSADFKP